MSSNSKKNEGGKANGLRKLQDHGFLVPDFVVLQADYHQSELLDFVNKYPHSTFAVRSSAMQEDGIEHSFAGQFESFLNIQGKEAIEAAIHACFDAAASARVSSYTKAKAVEVKADNNQMAVIVQCMIEAQYAGAAFSVDPVQNRKDLCLVQYVEGMGNQLMDGKKQAYSVQISKYDPTFNLDTPIDAEVLRKLQEGLLTLEQHSQQPVDVEWVLDKNNQLYWLQMRPVTTFSSIHVNELDSQLCFEGETLTRANVGEMMPGHMTPLTISTFGWAIEYGIQHFYKECGIISDIIDQHFYIKFFYNHGFISIGNLYKIADATLLAKHEYVEYNLLGRSLSNRIIPPYPVGFFKQCINQYKQIRYLSKAQKRLKIMEKMLQQVEAPEVGTVHQLYEWIDKQLPLLNTIYAHHYCTSARSGTLYTTLMSIISGSPVPNEHALRTVPYFMKNIPEIEGYLLIKDLYTIQQQLHQELPDNANMTDEALLHYLQKGGTDASLAFEQFLERHGHHCVREAELSEKDWSQHPISLMSSLRAASNALEQVKAIDFNQLMAEFLPDMGWLKKKIFLRFVRQTRAAVYMRERSKSISIKYQQAIKKTYIKLSELLMQQQILSDKDAIFYLTHSEIGNLLHNRLPDALERIQKRKILDIQYQSFQFKEYYMQHPYPVEQEKELDLSKGTVVSQGKVSGRVRLIHNLKEAQYLEKGDIMVCQYTDIGWTPYFARIAGIITEIGSALSHGAVIAREYGLPAVVNYSNALQIFEDNQMIEIDTQAVPPIRVLEDENKA